MVNFKILASMVTFSVAAAGASYGTFAFFSDTETSTDNLFTAGDLDLTLDGLNGITATITGTNFAPGDVTSGSILLRNEGSIFTGDAQGHLVDLDIKALLSGVDDTGSANDADDGGASLVGFERYLELTHLAYDGASLLASVGDQDGDGWANTLADLELRGVFTDLADPLAAGKPLSMSVLFRTDAPNHIKRDVVAVSFTFFLAQATAPDLAPTVILRSTGAPVSISGATWSTATTEVSPSGELHMGRFGMENVTLSLTSLPPHSQITVEYDLYITSSWDGNNPGPGPDGFRMGVDADLAIDTTFDFFNNAGTGQCWPANCPANHPPRTGAHMNDGLGYLYLTTVMDAEYRISRTFAHSDPSATIWWHGLPDEAISNEGWGLDNVRITVS